MAEKMRRDSEPDRKSRAEERRKLEEAVASLDGGTPREDSMPIQDEEPDAAQPFAAVEK